MTLEGQPWRLEIVLPHVPLEGQAELFAWIRDFVVPTILHAPLAMGPPRFRFLPPDDRSPGYDPGHDD